MNKTQISKTVITKYPENSVQAFTIVSQPLYSLECAYFCKGGGFESHPSNMPVIFFPRNRGKALSII